MIVVVGVKACGELKRNNQSISLIQSSVLFEGINYCGMIELYNLVSVSQVDTLFSIRAIAP